MKIKEFTAVLEKKKCSFALLYNSDSAKYNPNMFYFSGYSGLGALIIPKNKQPFLIAPEMEYLRAKKSAVGKAYPMEKKRFFESIYSIIKKHRLSTGRIAIDRNNFTLNSYRHFKKSFKNSKPSDIFQDCLRLRELKTNREQQLIKKSCSYTDRIFKKMISQFREFRTESEAAAFLEHEAKRNGLEPSFSAIVASGSNSSMPHHTPENIKLKRGFCVIDFGVKYKGYCSDMTRTIFIGKPNEKEKDIYNFLLNIQQNVINEIKINKKCSELYNFVIKNLGKYQKNFTHGLGHGVGVEIHELPNLSLNSKDKIQNGIAFTIEPGIYFPKRFGIRIEDTILFKNKPIVLTKTEKDLLIIP